MAVDVKLIGEKNHRQIVKTIDIHEDSYESILKMFEKGNTSLESESEHLIEDMFNVFGGSAFGAIVRFSIHGTIAEAINYLQDKDVTIKCPVKEIVEDFVESLTPCMCYSGDDELFFFSNDTQDIQSVFEKYIKPEYLANIKEALYSDFLDGNTALGLILYLRQLVSETK